MAKKQKNKKKSIQSSRKIFEMSLKPNVIAWILFGFTCLIYANSIPNGFTQDDAIVIYDNEFTTKGVSGIPDIMKYDTFRGFFKESGKDRLVSGGRYRPLTLVFFAVEWQIFGKNPFIGHLVNVILFGLTVVLMFFLLLKMLSKTKNQSFTWFVAIGSTLLFAAHPIHVEAVANIKGRDEIVALLGSLAAAYFVLKYVFDRKKNANWIGVLIFFIALFAKENVITFLGVIPLMLFVFTKESIGNIIKITVPYFGAAILFLIIRGQVIGWEMGSAPLELMNNPFVKIANNKYVYFSGGEKLATIFYTLLKYIQLDFIPHPLTHDYYPRHVAMKSFSDLTVILSIIIHFGLLIFALIQLPKRKTISFAILFYLGTLFLVSNIVFPVGTNMAERFLFMPSVGFCIAFSIIIYHFIVKKETSFKDLIPGLGVIVAISLIYGGLTIKRNMAWKDNYTLFLTDIKVSKNSAKLRNSVGGELIAQAIKPKNASTKNQMLKDAIVSLKEAVKIHPNYKNAYLLMGNAYNYLKDFPNSINAYQAAIKLDPGYKDALNNLGITYRNAGRYYGEEKHDINNALKYLLLAEQQMGNEFETIRLLGVAYGISGDNSKAIEYFIRGTQIQPKNAHAWLDLGNAYGNAGNTEKANEFRQKAVSLDPNILNK